MNIHGFENHVDKTILDRGYCYYIDGNVTKASKQSENTFLFQVEGSEDYEVLVETAADGHILHSQCDCPYDFGPVCKHEVAAYFRILAMLKGDFGDGGEKEEHSTIHMVLDSLSKKELIDIIVNLTKDDTILKNRLMVKFSKRGNQQEFEGCRRLINSIIRIYKGREGFIQYRLTRNFVRELEEVAEKARQTEGVLQSLDIAVLLFEEAIGAFQYADDSGGDIGSLVDETLELIEEITSGVDSTDPLQAEIFERLLNQVENEVLDGWSDYKIELLSICCELVDDIKLRKRLIDKIESMLDERSSDRYSHYESESMLQLLLELTKKYGTEEEAEEFIYEHLHYTNFREQLLNKLLLEKNDQKVIEFAQEGEAKDQQYPGLISKWKKFRYLAYKNLSLREEQYLLAKEFLFQGDFSYYEELKGLSSENKENFYTNLKQELKDAKSWQAGSMFLKLIDEENDVEELLLFVRSNPIYIEEYAHKLFDHDKEGVEEIYRGYIQAAASSSSNRKAYQTVCHILINYKRIAGKPKQVELIDELMELYKRRPAFLDELGKIK
ncbi:hypothetical protein V6B33_17455 [Mangrovibacillus sp. Mu-81]|uniref:SWIM zinc finger family protein n=1 Tax=Mangrovibacillus sp. Mu-81 TaxID=3121478 RepID=UPI002FE4C3B1